VQGRDDLVGIGVRGGEIAGANELGQPARALLLIGGEFLGQGPGQQAELVPRWAAGRGW
jgi:hypothetical protein